MAYPSFTASTKDPTSVERTLLTRGSPALPPKSAISHSPHNSRGCGWRQPQLRGLGIRVLALMSGRFRAMSELLDPAFTRVPGKPGPGYPRAPDREQGQKPNGACSLDRFPWSTSSMDGLLRQAAKSAKSAALFASSCKS